MKKTEEAASKKKPKVTPAQLRVQKGEHYRISNTNHPSDLTELELPETMKTTFPDPADILNFTLDITPDEGEARALPSS